MARKKRDPNKSELAQKILDTYQPESVEDMQEALKDIFGPLFESMLNGEMNHHLGYDKHTKDTENRRNGYGSKSVKTSYGEVEIDALRDRDASFEPQLIRKQQTDVSAIQNKVLAMYVRSRHVTTRYCHNDRRYLRI